jgi:putative restriction endonuclease
MERWTREQTIVALSLYWRIPYNQISGTSNRLIQETASIIGKTPGALAFKLMNLSSLDESRNHKGKSNASKLDHAIWDEFAGQWERLAQENERILANLSPQSILLDTELVPQIGLEKEQWLKTRINQRDFRERILCNYNMRCCITGIAIPALLVASHIKPWAMDAENRLNPRNGLCLNALHDKAFDRGLFTITTDYRIRLSTQLNTYADTPIIELYFHRLEGQAILLPDRFLPDPQFLAYHQDHIFV